MLNALVYTFENRYVQTRELPLDDETNELTDELEKVKKDKAWRRTYMVYELNLNESRKEGDAQRHVTDVKNIMEALNGSLEEACCILKCFVEDYESAKKLITGE